MTRRLLGPIGGPIIFLLVAGLVFGGLGWVTVASLQIERAQRETAAQAEVGHNLRVALWRLDGRLLPVFGVEDSRPFHHYASSDATAEYGPASAPLLAAPLPEWMRLHFQLSHDIGWDSPQVLPSETVLGLRQRWPGLPLRNITPDRIALLGNLRVKYPTALAIEVVAARERALPADSEPLAIPLFIDNLAPESTPAPSAPSPVNGRETEPAPPGLIHSAMPPIVTPPGEEGVTKTYEFGGVDGAPPRVEGVTNAYAPDASKKSGLPPPSQPAAEPQSAPALDQNQLRQNSRFADGSRGGEYPQRSQSVGRAMEDARRAYTFPNQNPLYGGVGPFALNRSVKPLAADLPGMVPPPAAASFGSPAPRAAGSGFGGGFGGSGATGMPSTPSAPPLPVAPAAASPTAPPGTLAFGLGTEPPPPPALPGPIEGDHSLKSLADRKDLGEFESLAKGAATFEYSFGKKQSSDHDSPANLARGIKKEPPGSGTAKDAEYFSTQPKDQEQGFFRTIDDALKAKEAEERLTARRKSESTGKRDRKELKSELGTVPPAAKPEPARGGAGTGAAAGGPIASGMLNPNAEKALPAPGGGANGLALAPTGPALGRPAAATLPERAAERKPAEPIPPTPDPAPPAVLEPVPAEPLGAVDGFAPTVAVHLGSMRPQWLTAADGTEILVLVRAARLENKTVYQGVVLDWPKLQKVLKEEVKDLFPEAKLIAVKDPSGVSPERTMTALPVQLDPGPAPQPAPAGWTPLRFGLVLAWAAAIIAFAAVGLCGWSLIDLSERRIRFVSAVTHELRTPLTSLRLYLDLLLSGMVQDEDKRREYLATLNAESDRLHRLIDNVLDFARLERQRKGTSVENVKITDLLDQVRSTWTDRCVADHKELHVVSTLPADAEIATDPLLVQQIIGNLIDNARKYTRDAEDCRIWVWAKPGGRNQIAFEVEDRGCGVEPRERALIFRPFRRGESADTKAGGAGLGLALSKQWAEVLGGRLTYRPADGGTGSCFRLELRVK